MPNYTSCEVERNGHLITIVLGNEERIGVVLSEEEARRLAIRIFERLGEDPDANPETLAEYREKKGLKQREVAERVGVTRQYYAKIEGEQDVSPSLSIAKRISTVLECPLKQIPG